MGLQCQGLQRPCLQGLQHGLHVQGRRILARLRHTAKRAREFGAGQGSLGFDDGCPQGPVGIVTGTHHRLQGQRLRRRRDHAAFQVQLQPLPPGLGVFQAMTGSGLGVQNQTAGLQVAHRCQVVHHQLGQLQLRNSQVKRRCNTGRGGQGPLSFGAGVHLDLARRELIDLQAEPRLLVGLPRPLHARCRQTFNGQRGFAAIPGDVKPVGLPTGPQQSATKALHLDQRQALHQPLRTRLIQQPPAHHRRRGADHQQQGGHDHAQRHQQRQAGAQRRGGLVRVRSAGRGGVQVTQNAIPTLK